MTLEAAGRPEDEVRPSVEPEPDPAAPVDAVDPEASMPVPVDQLLADDPGPVIVPVARAEQPPTAAPASTLTGRRGRYRLDELVGRGGASSVHRGWDRVLNRPVALKLLTYDIQPPPGDRHREARVVAGLDHPGLVPVYDVSHLDGHDAVVMALVEGPSLSARLRERGALSLVETLRLGAEVAGGLAHVHSHGVVHRDVKPANILLGPDGARLTDFGIARAPGATTLTGEGMILGTAAYLAPEQLREGDVTPAVDAFALGLVLLECLTGHSCYPSAPAACATRLDTTPDVPDDLPDAVAAILRSLTALDATARPTTSDAADRLHRLADAVEQGDDHALDAAAPQPTELTQRPVPFGAAVIGLLLAGAVLVAVLALVHGRADVAVPVLVAAVVAQGAVVWTTGRPGPPSPDTDDRPPAGHPPAPA